MKYEIKGDTLPVAICTLSDGDEIISQSGAMGWMSENIQMDTNINGGLFAGIGRSLSGESLFLNKFTCRGGEGIIAFPSSVPGKIVAKKFDNSYGLICQKGSFLAAESTVNTEIHFKKKLSSGFFGGEGFILQRLSGYGTALLEFDGHIEEVILAPGEVLKVDTGHVAAFDETVQFEVEMVKGVKNVIFGGEGLFLTVLKGPGKVYLQSMPILNLAAKINPFIATSK